MLTHLIYCYIGLERRCFIDFYFDTIFPNFLRQIINLSHQLRNLNSPAKIKPPVTSIEPFPMIYTRDYVCSLLLCTFLLAHSFPPLTVINFGLESVVIITDFRSLFLTR